MVDVAELKRLSMKSDHQGWLDVIRKSDLKWSNYFVVVEHAQRCLKCYEDDKMINMCAMLNLSENTVLDHSLLAPHSFTLSQDEEVVLTVKCNDRSLVIAWMGAIENASTEWD